MIARLSLAVLLLLQLTACAMTSGLGDLFEPDVYVVRRGDTVYSIAWRYQLDHEDLIRWNGLSAPYRIHPGQKLQLAQSPGDPPRASAGEPGSDPPATGTAADVADTATAKATPLPAGAPVVAVDLSPRRWIWPAEGQLLRTFAASDPIRKGLDIGGREGQPVIAAADGRIVYSGNGLPAYGNLLIVRHDEVYLSAYAHNRELLVKEGESVDQGQPIAYMGLDDNGQALLHFEIRRNGRPVDPLAILPKR